jgi:GH15 family glucan-1,4-alpha-glucosidase
MTYAPSGAVVAAPTTSLPEAIGGERNWDYRYCWLRDASMTMRALLDLGYQEEGRAFLAWLLHATHLTWPHLQVLYDVFGHTEIEEYTLDHLSGYRDSRPVRVGNAAADQLQLDVYGEVIGAAHEFIMRGGRLAQRQVQSLVELGEVVCEAWQQPDNGIWEARSGPRHHTFSKVMCWRALDGLITMHEHDHLEGPAAWFRRVRDEIRTVVEEQGYDSDVESYVQAFGGRTADASLLALPVQGYCAPDAKRMQSTYAFLEKELATGSLWRRYRSSADDGVSGSEAAFGICSFWAVEYLARAGRREAATHAFEELLSYANDVGLFAEEIDPEDGAALGNFPQASTHIGLINAALAIEGVPQNQKEAPATASK